MITSELREYCEGIISYYAAEYPYYFMCTDTTVTTSGSTSSYSQVGAYVYLSASEPTVNSQYKMTSDSWLVVYVLSSNASNSSHGERVTVSSASGAVSCSNFEYVYSNVESDYCFSSVEAYTTLSPSVESNFNIVSNVLICACLIALVVSIWLKR